MPSVPLVNSPVFGSAGTGNVRADPNITAPLANAQQHLAGAIEGASDLASKVKHATDTAYLIGAQSKLETTTAAFHTWTLQNPDTSGWQEQWDSMQSKALEDVQGGASKLSPMAKLHLQTETQNWQRRSGASIAQLQTQQSIKNAIGTSTEALNTAVANNDEEAARAVIKTAQAQGLFSASHAAAAEKRVTLGIATNLANMDIQEDPFSALEKIQAQGEDGSHVNYPGLTPAARTSLIFRANKMANETRRQTMVDWSHQIQQANEGLGPMPDKEGVMQEAQRQGIPAKWVERAFKAPAAFDSETYAAARNEIAKLDLVNDPDSKHAARAMELITQFKGPAAQALEKMVKDRTDPEHPINANPVFKEADQLNTQNFHLGLYGKYETKVQNKDGGWTTLVNSTVLRQAQQTQAQVRDALMKYIEDHPQAKNEEITRFLSSTYRTATAKAGADLFKFKQ